MNLFIRWLLYNRLRTANVHRHVLLIHVASRLWTRVLFEILCNLFLSSFFVAIVYEVLYRYMYQVPNVKTVADKMLHNRAPALRHDKFFQKGNLDIRE